MSRHRFISLILFLAIAAGFLTAQTSFMPETITYDVMFKWGLINKNAGSVSITLDRSNGEYRSKLAGASASWADKFYKVRDTLIGRMDSRLTPLYYENISHEGGKHKHDVLVYDYSGTGTVAVECTRKVYDKNGRQTVDEHRRLESTGQAVDMLTSFYFMRALDFDNMKPGDKETVDIFSGKRKELLTIHFNGRRDVKLDDRTFPSYYITFTFTSKGGKKTSDDMEAWISTGPRRIPLRLEGKLPVGKIRCFYTGPTDKL